MVAKYRDKDAFRHLVWHPTGERNLKVKYNRQNRNTMMNLHATASHQIRTNMQNKEEMSKMKVQKQKSREQIWAEKSRKIEERTDQDR